MRYRKVVPVEGFPVRDLFDASKPKPEWAEQAILRGALSSNGFGRVVVVSLLGSSVADPNGMIMRGPLGEVYPIVPEAWAAYEPWDALPERIRSLADHMAVAGSDWSEWIDEVCALVERPPE
jgi:hypothetical protein